MASLAEFVSGRKLADGAERVLVEAPTADAAMGLADAWPHAA
jgi:hypothetical protein